MHWVARTENTSEFSFLYIPYKTYTINSQTTPLYKLNCKCNDEQFDFDPQDDMIKR